MIRIRRFAVFMRYALAPLLLLALLAVGAPVRGETEATYNVTGNMYPRFICEHEGYMYWHSRETLVVTAMSGVEPARTFKTGMNSAVFGGVANGRLVFSDQVSYGVFDIAAGVLKVLGSDNPYLRLKASSNGVIAIHDGRSLKISDWEGKLQAYIDIPDMYNWHYIHWLSDHELVLDNFIPVKGRNPYAVCVVDLRSSKCSVFTGLHLWKCSEKGEMLLEYSGDNEPEGGSWATTNGFRTGGEVWTRYVDGAFEYLEPEALPGGLWVESKDKHYTVSYDGVLLTRSPQMHTMHKGCDWDDRCELGFGVVDGALHVLDPYSLTVESYDLKTLRRSNGLPASMLAAVWEEYYEGRIGVLFCDGSWVLYDRQGKVVESAIRQTPLVGMLWVKAVGRYFYVMDSDRLWLVDDKGQYSDTGIKRSSTNCMWMSDDGSCLATGATRWIHHFLRGSSPKTYVKVYSLSVFREKDQTKVKSSVVKSLTVRGRESGIGLVGDEGIMVFLNEGFYLDLRDGARKHKLNDGKYSWRRERVWSFGEWLGGWVVAEKSVYNGRNDDCYFIPRVDRPVRQWRYRKSGPIFHRDFAASSLCFALLTGPNGKAKWVDVPGTKGAFDLSRDGDNFVCFSLLGVPYKAVPIPEEVR